MDNKPISKMSIKELTKLLESSNSASEKAKIQERIVKLREVNSLKSIKKLNKYPDPDQQPSEEKVRVESQISNATKLMRDYYENRYNKSLSNDTLNTINDLNKHIEMEDNQLKNTISELKEQQNTIPTNNLLKLIQSEYEILEITMKLINKRS